MDRGVLVWSFRLDSESMAFGLITGADPVPAAWKSRENARAYEVLSTSNGWTNVLGRTKLEA